MNFGHKLFILAIPLLAACGDVEPPLTTIGDECGENAAQILVQDGFLMILCGCDEAGGTPVDPGTALSCTVDAGTMVVFNFQGTTQPHQIVATGTDTFTPSPPINLISSLRHHSITLDQSGSYSFRDAYNHALTGTITVP